MRQQLAGSASGLGGALMIGGGAALSALSGTILSTCSGAIPLLALMPASSALSVLAIPAVIRRNRRIGEA